MFRISRSKESDLYAIVPAHLSLREEGRQGGGGKEEEEHRVVVLLGLYGAEFAIDAEIPRGEMRAGFSRTDLFNAPAALHARVSPAPEVNARSHRASRICLQNSICEHRENRRINSIDNTCPRFFPPEGKNDQRDTAKFLINGGVFRAFCTSRYISDPLCK